MKGSFGYSDKLNLRTLASWCSFVVQLARARDSGVVQLRLSAGASLEGPLHPSLSGTQGKPGLCVLDLSNAYKQLPLHPSNRKCSIITLLDPSVGHPACFTGRVLPYGLTASVVHFNRCARLLQHIGFELYILWGNNFSVAARFCRWPGSMGQPWELRSCCCTFWVLIMPSINSRTLPRAQLCLEWRLPWGTSRVDAF